MSTATNTLHITGQHREWTIRPSSFSTDRWVVWASPTPADSNPAERYDVSDFDSLTDAYDAFVAADFADDGTDA